MSQQELKVGDHVRLIKPNNRLLNGKIGRIAAAPGEMYPYLYLVYLIENSYKATLFRHELLKAEQTL